MAGDEYHKIQTVFLRQENDKGKITRNSPVKEGYFSKPEFEYLQNNKWIFTEKIHGTNTRVKISRDKIDLNSRHDEGILPLSLIDKLNNHTFKNYKSWMNDFFPTCDEIIFYGEGYGDGIEDGKGYLKDFQDFIVFDIKIGGWWLERKNIEEICKKLELKIVPIIGEGTIKDAVEIVKNKFISEISEEPIMAEGIVAHPSVQLFNRKGERVIWKLKCRDFQ